MSPEEDAAETLYWEAVVEKSIHDAVLRRAEAAAHDERRERMLLGIDQLGVIDYASKIVVTNDMTITHLTLGGALRVALDRPVVANAGDTVTFKTGALRMTSD